MSDVLRIISECQLCPSIACFSFFFFNHHHSTNTFTCGTLCVTQSHWIRNFTSTVMLSPLSSASVTLLTAEDWLRSVESSNLWPPLTFKLCWGNETRRLQNRSCAEPLQELEKWPRMPNNVSSVFFTQVFKGSWLSSNTLQQSFGHTPFSWKKF